MAAGMKAIVMPNPFHPQCHRPTPRPGSAACGMHRFMRACMPKKSEDEIQIRVDGRDISDQ
jgi:hypothetical protein